MNALQFIAASHLRGEFSDPRSAHYYQFALGPKALFVAWTHGEWRCVHWQNDQPEQPADEAEAAAMREAERLASQMYDEQQQTRRRLQLVA